MKEKDLDELSFLWQQAKQSVGQRAIDISAVRKAGEIQKKNNLRVHYSTAIILSVTVAIIVYYFYVLYHFQDLISVIGYNLMIVGLSLRIVIEFISVWRSRRIKLTDTTFASLQQTLSFLTFRQNIHGPITITIFVLYFIGFYMLTPEFSRNIPLPWLIIMDVSAMFIALFLFYIIKKGINKEMNELNKTVLLHKALVKEEV